MDLETVERRRFVRLLTDEIERQNESFESARRGG
jgi:hypothetical protein